MPQKKGAFITFPLLDQIQACWSLFLEACSFALCLLSISVLKTAPNPRRLPSKPVLLGYLPMRHDSKSHCSVGASFKVCPLQVVRGRHQTSGRSSEKSQLYLLDKRLLQLDHCLTQTHPSLHLHTPPSTEAVINWQCLATLNERRSLCEAWESP